MVTRQEVQDAFDREGNARGFKVGPVKQIGEGRAIVLSRLSNGEYATHEYNRGSGAFSGHYYGGGTVKEGVALRFARKDFQKRVRERTPVTQKINELRERREKVLKMMERRGPESPGLFKRYDALNEKIRNLESHRKQVFPSYKEDDEDLTKGFKTEKF